MRTQTTYSATGVSILPPPTAEGSFSWHLLPVYSSQDSGQFEWFRSVYSDQPAFTKCQSTHMGFLVTRPPVAVQANTLVPVSSTGESLQHNPALTESLSTLNTIRESSVPNLPTDTRSRTFLKAHSLKLTASLAATRQLATSVPPPQTSSAKGHNNASPSVLSKSGRVSRTQSTPRSDRVVPEIGQPTQASITMPVSTSSEKPAIRPTIIQKTQALTLEDSLVLQPMASGGYAIRSGPTLMPGESGVVVSGTAYSLLSPASALLVNDKTIPIPGVPSNAPTHTDHNPKISARSSEVLFQGKTLAMTSTLTLGSGSVITRLALGTDSDGHTLLLGDTLTLAPTNGLSRFAIPSSSTPDVTVVVPSHPAASKLVSSSTTSNSASRNVRWLFLLFCGTMFTTTMLFLS